MIIRSILLLGVMCKFLCLRAQQSDKIEIGKPYPNPAFVRVQNQNGTENISLSAWRGKPLIVDFFTSFCVVCFKSLPKINKLQEQFKGELHFLLIGKEDAYIHKTYERFRQQLNLQLDVAYDSILHRNLTEYSYPLYVWIDSAGIVRGVTGVEELTADNISHFLKQNVVISGSPKIGSGFDPTKPYLVNLNGGNDSLFLSRSMFTKWKRGDPLFLPSVIHFDQPGDSLQLLCVSLADLYKYAYFGETPWWPSNPLYNEVFPFLILEDGKTLPQNISSELYCYSLWMSKQGKPMSLQKRFQYDLESQFGYTASVEFRLLPYYSLNIREGYLKKIISKKEPLRSNVTHAGFVLQSCPVSRIIDILAQKFQGELPFIDESRLDGPIDISIDAIMTDFSAVKEALYEKGIVLKLSVKPMRVIVLRPKEINVATK